MHGDHRNRYGLYQCKVENGSRRRGRHSWRDNAQVVPMRPAHELRTMNIRDGVPGCVPFIKFSKHHDFSTMERLEPVEGCGEGGSVLPRGQVHSHDRDDKDASSKDMDVF